MEVDDVDVDNFPIKIHVATPELDSNIGTFTYLVSGNDQLGTFEVRRRYNDFYYLRQCLVKKWPGLYIAPIAEKKIIGKKDEQLLQIRKKFFQIFLEQISRIKYFFYGTETQQFLRNRTMDMQKYYQGLPNPIISQLIILYKKTFKELDFSNMSVGDNNNIAINFLIYLKKVEKELKIMKDHITMIVIARDKFIENLNQCNNVLLPEYEKNVYSEYLTPNKKENKLMFVNNHQIQDSVRNLRDNSVNNPFNCCLNMISYEIRQVQAMQQALECINTYQSIRKKLDEKRMNDQEEMSKLMVGKITFKSIFSKGSKTDQIQLLQKQIPEIQKELQLVGQMYSIIICVLGNIQIKKFKKNKQNKYYKMMQQLSSIELKYLNSYANHMKNIMQVIKQ